MDYAAYCGFEDILLIGHAGKLLKLAQGIMNTHSRYADGRTTFLAMEAMFAGADRKIGRAIYESVTTDVAVDILKRENLLEAVMDKALKKLPIIWTTVCTVLSKRRLLSFPIRMAFSV